MRLILAFLMVYDGFNDPVNSKKVTRENKGYAFYYPLVMESKHPAKVCLEINNHWLPAKVNIAFQNLTTNTIKSKPYSVKKDFSCWEITVPEKAPNDSNSLAQIEVEIKTKVKNVKFTDQKTVQIIGRDVKIFTETDRRVYKMGDTVKIRLLALGFDLKPIKGYKIPLLQIKSPYPSQTIVQQWQNISTNLGLAQIEFQLAPDIPEGLWSISGTGIYATFDVKKYVLPRFQVSVNGPDRVYEGAKTITYSICGKYSYGRDVKGSALIILKVGDWVKTLNITQTKPLENGCAKFEFTGKELTLRNKNLWMIDVRGTVTEEGTDEVQSNRKTTFLNRNPYIANWDYSNMYIKPELPHEVKFSLSNVEVPLKSPLIEFCYGSTGPKNIACSKFRLNPNNSIVVTIPPLENVIDIKNIHIEAKLNYSSSSYNPIQNFVVWHSDSKNAIKILNKQSDVKECGSKLSFTVLYNSRRFKEGKNVEFKYIAKLNYSSSSYNPIQNFVVWHSDSKNAIKILNKQSDVKECGSKLSFTVLYNSRRFKEGKNVEFKYILSSRSEILSSGRVLHKPKKQDLILDECINVIGKEDYCVKNNPVDSFKLDIKLGSKVYTDSKLLVYYDYDNEVISDFIEIRVKKCSPNKVQAKWTKSPLYPGEVGELNIKTDSKSLCSVSSIDRASRFMGSSNLITTDMVLTNFFRYYYFHERNCIEQNISTDIVSGELLRFPYFSSLFDAFDSFKVAALLSLFSDIYACLCLPFHTEVIAASTMFTNYSDSVIIFGCYNRGKAITLGIGVISNMKFISKPCEPMPMLRPGIPILRADSVAKESIASSPTPNFIRDDRGSAIRSFFPETWLWDLVPVGENGQTTIKRKLPDSITDWVGNVLCVSSNKGFGISDSIELKAFKPFFLDVLLPYSIKRNKEILHLPIPIFNYLNHSLPIRVTLEPNNKIVLIDGQEKKSFSMCLAAGASYTHNYRIKSTKIGNVNITVSADVDPSYVKNCSLESITRRRDVVQKTILVEPEGYPTSFLKSALLCTNDSLGSNNIKWDINLPKNVVPDTINGKIIINSDILGPIFQNLENILVIPTGCGEQTMATLSPNLYVLKYLQASNALTNTVKEKILENLKIGYQRMLNYVHNDGSFSAFGNNDQEGSMFLTAFVIRIFKQMKDYIFIDDDVVNKAIKWIRQHQLKNGCFDPVRHIFHEMGLASSKNQTTALTSYVLISILETNTKIDQNSFSNATQCILNDKTTDKYALAISSYALGLMNLTEEAQKRLDKLIELAEKVNGSVWWKQSENSLSANVEVSSYVLTSLLQQDSSKNLGMANLIIRWLQTQMNPRGGFFSTQDTVTGLDAISRYAALVNKNEPNVKVLVVTKTDKREFKIIKRDSTKTEVIPLKSYPNKIQAEISGNGCVSIQAIVNYYIDKPLVRDDLKLEVTLKPVSKKIDCSVIEIKPCVSYTSPGYINMAIVEVNMFSSFVPNQTSLYELTSSKSTGVKKFEQTENKVIFYLIQLGAKKVCLPFRIEENLLIENIAKAAVKLYDYYEPKVSVSKSFSLDDCRTKFTAKA